MQEKHRTSSVKLGHLISTARGSGLMEAVLELKPARRLLAVRPSTGSPLHPAVKAWTAIPGQLAIARQGQLALKSRIWVWPNGAVTIQQFDEKTIWYMLLEIAPGRG